MFATERSGQCVQTMDTKMHAKSTERSMINVAAKIVATINTCFTPVS